MLRSLEQERAKYAWKCIREIKEEDVVMQKNYSSYVKKASVLIQTNGLANTLAFYYNKWKKGEKAYERLYNHIVNWDRVRRMCNGKEFLLWIIEDASSIDIYHITREIIALLSWMKRFAEAELKGE